MLRYFATLYDAGSISAPDSHVERRTCCAHGITCLPLVHTIDIWRLDGELGENEGVFNTIVLYQQHRFGEDQRQRRVALLSYQKTNCVRHAI
jgi:hypothetical protein